MREDVIGNLYPDTVTGEVESRPAPPSPVEVRPPREMSRPGMDPAANESLIDPHARFNGKYASDRDLRIEGEAQGEIECQGTLIISPQARVRSAITAHNVVVNGDYEGDVDCGGRFEIGPTGRVRGTVKTQVLVVKEGAHWEGSVSMSGGAAGPRSSGTVPPLASTAGRSLGGGGGAPSGGPLGGSSGPAPGAAGGGSIFSKQDRGEAGGGQPPQGNKP